MSILVVDASALAEYLFRSESGLSVGELLEASDADIHVPALCDLEIAAVIRRALLEERLDEERAGEALQHYLDLPLARHGHLHVLARVIGPRHNFSAYDAAYLALAEALGGLLLTADERFHRAARRHSRIQSVLAGESPEAPHA